MIKPSTELWAVSGACWELVCVLTILVGSLTKVGWKLSWEKGGLWFPLSIDAGYPLKYNYGYIYVDLMNNFLGTRKVFYENCVVESLVSYLLDASSRSVKEPLNCGLPSLLRKELRKNDCSGFGEVIELRGLGWWEKNLNLGTLRLSMKPPWDIFS